MEKQNPDEAVERTKHAEKIPSPEDAVGGQLEIPAAQDTPTADGQRPQGKTKPAGKLPGDAQPGTTAQSKIELKTRDVINSSLQAIEHQTQVTQAIENVLIGGVTAPVRMFSMA